MFVNFPVSSTIQHLASQSKHHIAITYSFWTFNSKQNFLDPNSEFSYSYGR